MAQDDQIETFKEALLAVHVEQEKLKFIRKDLLQQAAILGIVALIIVGLGIYARFIQWTEFPIFPATIAAGCILLGIGFRPLQDYKNEFAEAEEKRKELENLLKKDNLGYKADVVVSMDDEGAYDIKKSIKIHTIT